MTDPIVPEPTPTPAAPAYAPAPAAAGGKTNTLAIVALILGFLVPLGGIICGHIALGQIKRTGEGGHGLALAGTILGYVFTAFWIIYIIVVVAFVGLAASTGNITGY